MESIAAAQAQARPARPRFQWIMDGSPFSGRGLGGTTLSIYTLR
jgi:hypothetical protein